MRPTTRRLEQLERARRTLLAVTNPSGATAILLERVNRVAERLRTDPDWPPWPIPTVEEVRKLLQATLDRVEKRT
jgi:hypothetical protein